MLPLTPAIVDDCGMGSVEGAAARSRGVLSRVWLRVGHRADGRAPLWMELLVVGWLFWLYDVINNLAPLRRALALANAAGLLSVERSLHLDPERAMDHWLAGQVTLAQAASYYYFFTHGLVTFAALAWLWWKAPALYRRLRTRLVIINLIAFAVFWRYPLAPPRMLPHQGFIDVVGTSHAFVSWSSGALLHNADQLAAMPSLHVAWAIWSGLAFWELYRRRAVAALAVAYPLLTSLTVMATGNHYLLDVLAGAATVPTAILIHRGLDRAWALLRQRAIGTPALEAAGVPIGTPALEPAGVLPALDAAAAVEDGREARKTQARAEPSVGRLPARR